MPRVARLNPKPARIRPTEGQPFKLKLAGAYQGREEGFIGIADTKTDAIDFVVDLKIMPWPIDDAAVDMIFCAFYFHRLDPAERIAFMNECWRVLKPGAQMILVVPNWSSGKAISDPRAKWPPLGPASFVYYNKEWRENDRYDDIGITCDFDYGYGFALDPDIQPRNQDYQQHAIKYWVNTALDLHVTLTRRA